MNFYCIAIKCLSIIKSYTPKVEKLQFFSFRDPFVFKIVIFNCNLWFQTIHVLILFSFSSRRYYAMAFVMIVCTWYIVPNVLFKNCPFDFDVVTFTKPKNSDKVTTDYFDMIFSRKLMIILLHLHIWTQKKHLFHSLCFKIKKLEQWISMFHVWMK